MHHNYKEHHCCTMQCRIIATRSQAGVVEQEGGGMRQDRSNAISPLVAAYLPRSSLSQKGHSGPNPPCLGALFSHQIY